ncbi:hypothetical protein LCGC14_0814080 [marine sediment metagenome]|uniref:Uncharacterized protein n=1 Tax=marine sediment metagenome TaxID=412755 RepID=A0A0F9PKS7_9ZZZZ
MKGWGRYNRTTPACDHLISLREFLVRNRMSVYSEHGEEPDGWINWINIHCKQCHRVYEEVLQAPWYGEVY